jgi:hypothetical protein
MPALQTVQPQKAAYFPHVEFASTAWVKNALLYWEAVARGRPAEASPHDDDEIKQLVDAGLVENVEPAPVRRQALPEIGQRFEELVRSHGGRLPACIPGVSQPRGTTPEREQRVRAEIMEGFREYPLARNAFHDTPDQARAVFFSAWAEVVTREKRYAPITDDPMFEAIATYFAHDKITDDPKTLSEGEGPAEDGSAIALLCLPTPSLEAIAQLPVHRLLEIRKKYAAQRRHFRETVQAQLAAIAELPTPEAIKDHLKGLQDEIRDDLRAAREATEDAKVKERWSLLGITAPASLAAGVSMAGSASALLGPIGGAGTLALAMTSWFVRGRKGAHESKHYLLSVDSSLKSPWQGLTRAFHDLSPHREARSSRPSSGQERPTAAPPQSH